MDTSSPEVVAARAVAVFTIERVIRDRTAIVVWAAAAVAVILVVGSVVSDGVGAVLLGVLALLAGAVTATLFAVRAVVLRLVRRIAGGPEFARVRPVIERHMANVEDARGLVPLDAPSVIRLAWLARRPADLRAQVQQTAATVTRTIPVVVADVRRELASRDR
jgi:hypothetical protein